MMYAHEMGLDHFAVEQPSQPKFVVGEYLAANGFLVPERHSAIEGGIDMLARKIDVIARHEGRDQYGGPSGLGDSRTVFPSPRAVEQLEDIAANPRLRDMDRYAIAAGIDPVAYAAEASLSYWECIPPGTNVSIVRDKAVAGRWHLFGMSHNESDDGPALILGGALIDESGAMELVTSPERGDTLSQLPRRKMIEIYEQICALPKFNSNHCPIIEMQVTDAGEIYVLQYHRTNDRALSKPNLDPTDFDKRDGWEQAEAAIGAFIGERAMELVVAYATRPNGTVEINGDGYIGDNSDYEHIEEIAIRKSLVDISLLTADQAYANSASGHGQRSRTFKSRGTSLMLGNPDFLTQETRDEAKALSQETGKNVAIGVDVASDGHRAWVRRRDGLIVPSSRASAQNVPELAIAT